MAKKISENSIPDIHADWGNDKENNLPYSGSAVQTFIKSQLSSKIGLLYYDATSNTYKCFASDEDRDAYIDDPDKNANKVLGSFAAQSIYSASILMQSATHVSLLYGTTGNVISFSFGVYTTNGNIDTGDSVVCTYTITGGNKKRTVVKQYAAGENVSFNVDEYLAGMTGRVVVRISILGVNTQAAATASVIYNIFNVQLEDSFDITKLYNDTLEIPFTLTGDGVKAVEFYVDGKQIEYNKNEDEITAATGSKTKYISTDGLSDGVHTLQMRAYVMMQEKKQYATLLYREFFVCREAADVSYVALSINYPPGADIVTTAPTIPNMEQFIGTDIKFASYNNSGDDKTSVSISLDDELLTTMECSNGTVYTYKFMSKTSGIKTLKIGARSLTVTVQPTTLDLSELTDRLTLLLDATGKSNSSKDKAVWVSDDKSAVLSGFDWTEQSGWNDGWLVIPNGASVAVPYAPLATDTAKTIEFEFGTEDVKNDDAVVCDMRGSEGAGILITASQIELISRSSAASGSSDTGRVGTRFKSGESYRITFVITPKTGAVNKCMAFVYVNGILSGATSFTSTDNFVSDKQINIVGSDDCTVKLRQIRCYDKALGDDDILNNYILYRPSVSEMLSVYERNNVTENGTFAVSKLEGELPVAVITGNIPAIEATTDKKHVEYVDIDFYDLKDRTKNFSWKNVYMTPQGTSSMTYPRKNLRPYIAKKDSTECYDADGKPYSVKKYAHITGSQPCDRWTWKADFAESSGTHNAGIAMLWNKVLYNSVMGGKYVFRTEAQKTAAANGFPYDVRTTVAGFPMVVFYRLTKDDDLVFMGKYNFLNDKSSESVFGFKDISGVSPDGASWEFDNSKVECWECLANKEEIALMKSVNGWDDVIDSKGTKRWMQSFEGRYPDGSTNDTALKKLVTWVASTDGNLAKWKAEKADHFNLPLLCAYYVYLMRFGAVDQPVKNAMLTTEDGVHWFFINYDNDTINGVRNDGLLKYDPYIDRQSKDAELNDYCYAGHDSVLWNNFEADDECMEMVREVDAALQQGGLTYEKVLSVFNDDFSGKWCERVYNQDAEYKYIAPYTDKGLNYLSSLQGSRKAHREWWLSQRFSLLDAKWVTGDFRADVIQFLIPADGIKQYNFTIVAAQELYYGWGVNNVVKESNVHLLKGESHTFTTNQAFAIGDPVRIYAGPEIASVDIHEMGNVIAHLNVNGAYSERKGTNLEKLVVGGEDVSNTALTSGNFTGLADCAKLKYLDIRGMKGLTDIDTAGLTHLETLLLDNSGLTSLTLKNCPIASLSLPSSIISLDIEGLKKLNGLSIDTTALRTLTVKNCAVDIFDMLKNWAIDSSKQYSIDIEDVNWKGKTTADAIAVGQKIKSAGGTLKGRIEVDSITSDNYQQLMEVFGDNCFSARSSMYVYAKGGTLIVLAPKSIVEGRTGKISVVGVEDGATVSFIVTGGSDRATVDNKGVVTVKETGSSGSITVMVSVIKGDNVVSSNASISIAQAVYPSLSVDGATQIAEDASYHVKLANVTGQNTDYVRYAWSISGKAAEDNNVKLSSESGESTTVNVISNPDAGTTKQFKLTLTGYKGNGTGVNSSVDITLYELNKIVCYDSSADVPEGGNTNQPLMELAKANSWLKKDGVNLWSSDCLAVTSLPSGITELTTFDEFQYFTGITSLSGTFKNLMSIKLPESLTSLSASFSNVLNKIRLSSKLSSLSNTIKAQIIDVGRNTSLSYNLICYYKFIADSNNEKYEAIDNLLCTKDVKNKRCVRGVNVQNVVIPDSVTSLGERCFEGCSSLTSVTIPDSVTSLGGGCFYGCASLTSVTIPDSVTEIGSGCFSGCSSLTSIIIPDSVVIIGGNCFAYCSNLSDVHLSNKLKKLSANYDRLRLVGFFEGCSSLTSITIPDSVTSLGSTCFQGCSKLTKIYFDALTPPTILSDTFAGWSGKVYTMNYTVYRQATNWSAIADRILLDDRYTYTYKSLTITADNVIGNETKTKIHWTEVVTKTKDGVSTDVTFTGDVWSEAFEQNTSKTDTVQRTITYTRDGLTATTTITQGVWNKGYTVDLNNQWRTSSDIANPDSTSYDGVYESNSNYHVASGVATMSIKIVGYDSFTVLVRSNGENNYDYVIVGKIDAQPTTSDYQADTKGAATSGTAVSNYKEVTFTGLGQNEHTIYIAYRKDSSSDSGTDRGYVLIPKNQ